LVALRFGTPSERGVTALDGLSLTAPEPAPAALAPGAAWIPAIDAYGQLFPIEKLAAHRVGQLHLAVSVFVFRGADLLIQQRAAGKYHCAGQWANTCCSHPHWGEAIDAAASRRLREELGLDLPLVSVGQIDYAAEVTDGLIEHERVHVFRGELSAGASAKPDPAEVANLRWASPAALAVEAVMTPEAFAPWFRIYLRRWRELGLAN
jgi:isopentenyl-diphosphate Delta-isomerase